MANSGYLKMLAAEKIKQQMEDKDRERRADQLVTPNGTVLSGPAAAFYRERYQMLPYKYEQESKLQSQKDRSSYAERAMAGQTATELEKLQQTGQTERQSSMDAAAMGRTEAEMKARLQMQDLQNKGGLAIAKTGAEANIEAAKTRGGNIEAKVIKQYDSAGMPTGETVIMIDKNTGESWPAGSFRPTAEPAQERPSILGGFLQSVDGSPAQPQATAPAQPSPAMGQRDTETLQRMGLLQQGVPIATPGANTIRNSISMPVQAPTPGQGPLIGNKKKPYPYGL